MYRFYTDTDFWLKLRVNTLDIAGGTFCSRGYLDVKGEGKYCSDSPPQSEMVIHANNVNMEFHSERDVKGRGVNITVTSVRMYPFIIKSTSQVINIMCIISNLYIFSVLLDVCTVFTLFILSYMTVTKATPYSR